MIGTGKMTAQEEVQHIMQRNIQRRISTKDTLNPCNKLIRKKTDRMQETSNLKDTMQHILQSEKKQENNKPEQTMQHILQPKKRQQNRRLKDTMQHILQPKRQKKESDSLHPISQPAAGG